MPRNPVSASAATDPRATGLGGGRASRDANTGSDTAAHKALSATHTTVVRINPSAGINQKAIAKTPMTAPSVLLAYSGAIECPRCPCTVSRSIAGSVAPMAAVAGKSRKKVPQNATVHCHNTPGVGPMIRSSRELHGDMANANTRLQQAMIASQLAYQRTGWSARSIRGPRIHAPMPRPPKNAVTTASTAADSWPSHNADCWVQIIWYPRPANPDANISASAT